MNIERWRQFTKKEQIGAIFAEIARATHWEKENRIIFLQRLEAALQLIDASLDERRWHEENDMLNVYMLLYLRDEIAKYYIGEKKNIAPLLAVM